MAHQAPPSLGFSRQEHWSGLPFPSPMHEREKWKWSCSVVSDSSRPHGVQPTRLLRPWDFPGKSTGVGCHCLVQVQNRYIIIKFKKNGKGMLCIAFVTSPHPRLAADLRVSISLHWSVFCPQVGAHLAAPQTDVCLSPPQYLYSQWALLRVFVSLESFCHSVCSGGTSDHPVFCSS